MTKTKNETTTSPATRGKSSATPEASPVKLSRGTRIIEWTKSLLMGFVLFLVLRTFVIQTFTITSGSMEGTLLVGDFLVLSKSAYGATVPGTGIRLPGYTDPRRGDIVVFRGHHEPIDLVKRLVGMPGDTLTMRNGVLFLNGARQEEPFAHHTDPAGDGTHPWMLWQRDHLLDGTERERYRPTRDNWGPIVVPANYYFVLGDNRDESLDSRYWGFVDEVALKGKAVVLYFSYDGNALSPVPIVKQVRWTRIGDLLR
jgi:signal peptidase I